MNSLFLKSIRIIAKLNLLFFKNKKEENTIPIIVLPEGFLSREEELPEEVEEVEVFFENGQKRPARFLQDEFIILDEEANASYSENEVNFKIIGWKYV